MVAPSGAAGLGDFARDTNAAAAAGLLEQRHYTATFQGPDAEASVAKAIAQAVADHAYRPFDALIIIRGGGSALDLAWMDALAIARAVATAPLPVFVGIGHERDRGILDEVAHASFDTPSKVSAHIVGTIIDRARAALRNIERVQRLAQSRITALTNQSVARWSLVGEKAKSALQRRNAAVLSAHSRAVSAAQTRLLRCTQVLQRRWDQITGVARKRIHAGSQSVAGGYARVTACATTRLQLIPHVLRRAVERVHTVGSRRVVAMSHAVERHHLQVVAADPARILARGYAVVRNASGRVIGADAPAGEVSITWQSGTRRGQLDAD